MFYKFRYTSKHIASGQTLTHHAYFSSRKVFMSCLHRWNDSNWSYSIEPSDIAENVSSSLEKLPRGKMGFYGCQMHEAVLNW